MKRWTASLMLSLAACSGETEGERSNRVSQICSSPAPAIHRVRYDVHGRPSEVSRTGAGRVEYVRDPGSGLISERRFIGEDGALVRRVVYQRDAAGRVQVKTHSAGASAVSYQFTYDHSEVSSVSGPGFVKTFEYRADGSTATTSIDLAGWRSVVAATTNHANGDPKTSRISIRDAAGAILQENEKSFEYDGYGRFSRLLVDGNEIYRLEYDGEGRLARVVLPSLGEIVVEHDPETHEANGYRHREQDFELSVGVDLGPRGLIASESYEYERTDGEARSLVRTFHYDARGFLEAVTGTQSFSYAYDARGLMTSAEDGLGARTIVRSYDSLGRISERAGTVLHYGPTGDVEQVTIGDRTITFAYDESGHRLLKYEDGQPVAAYVFDGVLTASGFVEPIRIGERLVGVLENGVFRALPFDPRGTLLLGAGEAFDPPSPFGARAGHSSDAAAIDYVGRGYDADLGTVRMGVRDYDPALGTFLTPDPLFLEEPEQCIDSPVDCNLYTYARNDPLRFVDPSGEKPTTIRGWISYVVDAFEARLSGRTFSPQEITRMSTYQKQNAKSGTDACITAVRNGMRQLYDDPLLRFRMSTIENGMADMQKKKLVGAPKEIAFRTSDGKLAKSGALTPHHLDESVFEAVFKMADGDPGYSVFVLSLLDGYHAVTLTLDNRDPDAPKIYWSDQWASKGGFKEFNKEGLDKEVTKLVHDWWKGQPEGKKHNTVVRIWRVFRSEQ